MMMGPPWGSQPGPPLGTSQPMLSRGRVTWGAFGESSPETEPLLRRPKDDMQDHSSTTKPGSMAPSTSRQPRHNAFAHARLTPGMVAGMMLVVWLIFALIGLMFVFMFHAVPSLVVVLLVALFITLAGLAASELYYSLELTDPFVWALVIGSITVIVASMAGYYNYCRIASDYWSYHEHRHYGNVWPDELAAAHMDASAIVFPMGAKADVARARGFATGHHVYCVAPVIMQAAVSEARPVQFWAAGMDCCDPQGNKFTCGEAGTFTAHSGLVVRNQTDIFDDFSVRELVRFMDAANMSAAMYGFQTSHEPMFVRWASDLAQARLARLHDAVWFWFSSILKWLVLCVIFGVYLYAFTRFTRLQALADAKKHKTAP